VSSDAGQVDDGQNLPCRSRIQAFVLHLCLLREYSSKAAEYSTTEPMKKKEKHVVTIVVDPIFGRARAQPARPVPPGLWTVFLLKFQAQQALMLKLSEHEYLKFLTLNVALDQFDLAQPGHFLYQPILLNQFRSPTHGPASPCTRRVLALLRCNTSFNVHSVKMLFVHVCICT